MERAPALSMQHGTVASFAIAVVSLALTCTNYLKSQERSQGGGLKFFNMGSDPGAHSIQPIEFHAHSHTNRTIWETVNTGELHAGLQRVEAGAWMPPHSHPMEEIILLFAGRGIAYDENGEKTEIWPGTMVHIKKGARHAFQNVGEEPMWLLWSFPTKLGVRKFEFRDRYAKG